MSLGMKLVSAHKILNLNDLICQIDFNTGKRKNVASSFENGFFKLINNSVYDKTMEYLRK